MYFRPRRVHETAMCSDAMRSLHKEIYTAFLVVTSHRNTPHKLVSITNLMYNFFIP